MFMSFEDVAISTLNDMVTKLEDFGSMISFTESDVKI